MCLFCDFGVGAGVGVVWAGTVLWRALELGALWIGRRVKRTICPARGGTRLSSGSTRNNGSIPGRDNIYFFS